MVLTDHFGEATAMIATILPEPGKWSGPVIASVKNQPPC
jgi:hypothetical protein